MSLEEYFVNTCVKIADWSYFQSSELMAKLFLWVFGPVYDSQRFFPLPLGPEQWQPKLNINPNNLALFLLRGICSYLFSTEQDEKNLKYQFIGDYFISIFVQIDSDVYAMTFLESDHIKENGNRVGDNWQYILRRFIANLEGVATHLEVRKNNGEIYHNDLPYENQIREGLKKLDLPKEYYDMVEFVHKHKDECLIVES